MRQMGTGPGLELPHFGVHRTDEKDLVAHGTEITAANATLPRRGLGESVKRHRSKRAHARANEGSSALGAGPLGGRSLLAMNRTGPDELFTGLDRGRFRCAQPRRSTRERATRDASPSYRIASALFHCRAARSRAPDEYDSESAQGCKPANLERGKDHRRALLHRRDVEPSLRPRRFPCPSARRARSNDGKALPRRSTSDTSSRKGGAESRSTESKPTCAQATWCSSHGARRQRIRNLGDEDLVFLVRLHAALRARALPGP